MKTNLTILKSMLCAMLLCAGMLITSCEEIDPVNDEKTEQGGNENNGNENITLSELSVVPGSFKAEIIGSVTGFSEQDKEQIKVGILYSSESGQVENGEGKRVETSEISADGIFSVLLSDLNVETKYYYCGYLYHGGTYTYGTPAEFTTLKNPYDHQPDLDVAAVTDLSSSGSANCYIVLGGGLYKFKTVKGNSNESVGSVASAQILWETFGTSETPECFDLIRASSYKDGYITFQTADIFKEGNAVIAAKDAEGTILWSWHIWFTDQPREHVYNNNAGTMMDRNLGATSAAPGDVGALGLLYQWGRKDPFLGASGIASWWGSAKSTITWPSAVLSNSSNGTIEYATAYPTTFIGPNTDNNDWYYTGLFSDNARWTTSSNAKSIHDPCPSGWRVPDGDVWANAGFTDGTYDSINKGMSFNISSPSTAWYPASSYCNYGSVLPSGSYGYYWSCSANFDCLEGTIIDSNYTYCLYITANGQVRPLHFEYRALGLSVRCLKESN